MSLVRYLVAFATALMVGGCGAAAKLPTTPSRGPGILARTPQALGGAPRFLGRNARYRIAETIAVHLEDINADIRLAEPTRPLLLEKKESYGLALHQATAQIDGPSLSALMNTYVFNDADTPIKDVVVTITNDKLTLAARVKKVFWIPFSAEGDLSATPDGHIRFSPRVVRSAGVRVDDLLDLFGLEIARLLALRKEKGITLAGNDIIMDVAAMIPAPRMSGRVARVRPQGGQLVIGFDDGRAQPFPVMPVAAARNYLAVWGGNVALGNITVANAKVQLCDAEPVDPLAFSLESLRDQLEAGVVTPTKDGHLIAYVPDLRFFGVPFGRFAPVGYPVPGVAYQPRS